MKKIFDAIDRGASYNGFYAEISQKPPSSQGRFADTVYSTKGLLAGGTFIYLAKSV